MAFQAELEGLRNRSAELNPTGSGAARFSLPRAALRRGTRGGSAAEIVDLTIIVLPMETKGARRCLPALTNLNDYETRLLGDCL